MVKAGTPPCINEKTARKVEVGSCSEERNPNQKWTKFDV